MSQASDKSEKATPAKLKKAREKGEANRSKELSSAISLAVAFFILLMLTPWYRQLIQDFFRNIAAQMSAPGSTSDLLSLTGEGLRLLLLIILSFCFVPLVAGITTLFSGGWVFSVKKIVPDAKRLNPLTGIARLFAVDNLIELVKVIIKAGIILLMLCLLMYDALPAIMQLSRLGWPLAISHSLRLAAHLFGDFVLLMLLFALIEWPLSRFRFQRKMRMTRQEVKDEFKHTEGNPQIKGRLRQLQRQIAQGQLRKTVPQASVVITNPTHYAVALKYDPQAAAAPYVVAKGTDELALYIRQIASEHHIEVVEFAPLARSVYASTRVNQQIPNQLYQAIAHVLTYVMQLRRWRADKTIPKPAINRKIPMPSEGQFRE